MTDDGRLLALLALLGLTATTVVRGSRGVARSSRSRPQKIVMDVSSAGPPSIESDYGDPNRKVRAPVGSLYHDRVTNQVWVSTGDGTWSPVQAGSGTPNRGSRGIARAGRTKAPWSPKPGDRVGARRWPLASAHPDAWEHPHAGVVLEFDDPLAWENTAAFRDYMPSQEEVERHLEGLTRAGVKLKQIPVAWEFSSGKVYWEDPLNVRPFEEDLAEWQRERKAARRGSRAGGNDRRSAISDPSKVLSGEADHWSLIALQGSRGLARPGRPNPQSPVSTYDNPDYAYYVTVVSFPRTPPGVIDSGWEYKEDANDRKKELEEELADLGEPYVIRVLSRKGLRRDQVDPEDDARWRVTIPRRSV